MERLVLDTNCLIQILPRRSKYHAVWQNFLDCRAILCVSNEILMEYLEILQRLINIEVAENVIKVITNSPFVEFIDPYYDFKLIKEDPDDNKFVNCAIAARARCIITNDHHYDILERTAFPKVLTVTLEKYYKELVNNTKGN